MAVGASWMTQLGRQAQLQALSLAMLNPPGQRTFNTTEKSLVKVKRKLCNRSPRSEANVAQGLLWKPAKLQATAGHLK
jgi:hypothetical protein